MKIKRVLTPLLIILLLFSIVVIGAPDYGNVGPTTEFGFDIKIEDEIVAEGSSADDHETTILFTDPTADRTITIPDSDQTVGTATSVEDNSIVEADLKAVDEPADEDILTKEDTTGDFEWHSAAEIKALMSLDLVANLKVKLDATSAPTVNNDIDEGYTVGSRWIDVINDKEYVCLDNADGAAVWTETTGAAGGYTNLTSFVDQTAWRLFYSNADGDVVELPLGADGTYLGSNGATSAPSFGTPAGAGDMLKLTYDTDEDSIVDKSETVDDGAGNSSTAADVKDAVTKKHTQNTDTDLDATFEATFVKKTDTVNVLSDITSPGADIEDAVTKKHTSGSETQGGDISGTVGNASVNKIKRGLDASKSATPAVGDIYLATDTDKLYKCITAEAWTLLKNLDLSGNNVADLADVTSAGANIEDAVTKKHSQNADTDLDATFEATFVKKVDTINVLSDITSAGSFIEDAVTERHIQNTDIALGTQTEDLNMGTHKIIGVVDPANPQDAATKAYADTKVATEVDPTVDSDEELKAILVDEVTKTGDFTAERMAIINNASGIIEEGTNTDADVADAVTKKHTQNTDTQFDFYNALASDHTWSGDKDTQPVGENVVFGDILYQKWADHEWYKAKADAYATARGTRIALETKTDGETCLMLVKGYIRDDSAFDFGAVPIFLNDDTAGTCDDTAPAESGDQIFMVGEAKSADILFFNPGQDVGEI